MRLAHGLSAGYSLDDATRDIHGEGIALSLAWHDRERTLEQILAAKRITRARFMQTLAFPKPSRIFNLVICSELNKRFDVSGVTGFIDGVFDLPKGDGVLVPDKEFTHLRFVRMSEMLKARQLQSQ